MSSVRVLSSLECNLYRLLVASLTAGLNIVPIMENSHESSRGNVSGYYRNLGSLRAGTRDITEVAVLAARPAKRFSIRF